jgi:hypothetical protein
MPAVIQATPNVAFHPQPSPAELQSIRTLLGAGLSRRQVGIRMNLTRAAVSAIVYRMKKRGMVLPPRAKPGPKIIARSKPLPTFAVEPLTATAATLLDLDHNACRWPLAGEGRETLFCGADRDGHRSYCRQHAARSVVVEAPGVCVRPRVMAAW